MAKSIHSIACLMLIVSAAAMQCAAAELPNIVIVYADDLGYGDLSCCNPKAACKTPRLDRMATTKTNSFFAPNYAKCHSDFFGKYFRSGR